VSLRRRVLLVAPTVTIADAVCRALHREHDLTFISAYSAAKTHLDTSPDVLVVQLKLGEYNGLHLALRASRLHIPAVVIGDPTFRKEAEQLGAMYVSDSDLAGSELSDALRDVLDAAASKRSATLPWHGVADLVTFRPTTTARSRPTIH
jgi:DNA-binding response OmpR family regulator